MRHVAFKATHVRPHFTRETESLLFRTGLEPGFPNNCDHLFTPSLPIPRLMASIRTATCARLRNTTLLKRACSSFRAAGLTGRRVVGPHKVRRPVRLPRAVVIRERLLPMGMIAVELIPRVADFHGATIVLVLAVEGAVIAVEAPGHRRLPPPPSHRRYLPNRATTGLFPDRTCAVPVLPTPSSGSRVHPPSPCRRGRESCTEGREILPIRRRRLRAFSSGAGVSSPRQRSSQSHE